jgi:RNA polymerase sigma-70 factor (ECF subfamily)
MPGIEGKGEGAQPDRTEPPRADDQTCGASIMRDMAAGYAPEITDPSTAIDLGSAAAMADEDQLSLPGPADSWTATAAGYSLPRFDAVSFNSVPGGEVEGVAAALDFGAFYDENRHRLSGGLRFLFRGDIDHAEDIAQQAFKTAFEHWDQICVSVRNPYGYVYKIAWRLALSFREAQHRDMERARDFTRSLQGEHAAADPNEHLDLFRAVRQLPDHERTVVGLSLIMGSGPKEIAEVLGLPEGTVRAQLKRGRDRLVKIIGDLEAGRS